MACRYRRGGGLSTNSVDYRYPAPPPGAQGVDGAGWTFAERRIISLVSQGPRSLSTADPEPLLCATSCGILRVAGAAIAGRPLRLARISVSIRRIWGLRKYYSVLCTCIHDRKTGGEPLRLLNGQRRTGRDKTRKVHPGVGIARA